MGTKPSQIKNKECEICHAGWFVQKMRRDSYKVFLMCSMQTSNATHLRRMRFQIWRNAPWLPFEFGWIPNQKFHSKKYVFDISM